MSSAARHSARDLVASGLLDLDWIAAQLGFGPDDKVLVALGGIRPYKGLGRLLDVFHELADEDPSLQLLVAG